MLCFLLKNSDLQSEQSQFPSTSVCLSLPLGSNNVQYQRGHEGIQITLNRYYVMKINLHYYSMNYEKHSSFIY